MTERVLQRSPGRTVVVEDGGTVVRKTFSGDAPEALAALAGDEYDRLERCHAALADLAGVKSPRPLEIRAGAVAELRMERASGLPLLALLRTRRLDSGLVAGLSALAASGAIRCVEALGEPYDDFQFDNMLLDDASGVLTFVDLGRPDRSSPPPAGASALEVTLGNLVGSTMFQSARPKWLCAVRQHRQAVRLCTAIVARAADHQGEAPSAHGLQACAVAAYERSAFTGGWAARLWYSSVGWAVARRPEVLGVRVRPPRRPWSPQPIGSPPSAVPGRTNRK